MEFRETIDDDAEYVVISHPTVIPNAHPGPHPIHIHHDRTVICGKAVNEIVLEPVLGHPHKHRYIRTENKDKDGRPIFVEAK